MSTCSACPRSLSPDDASFVKDGLAYCCPGCAGATGCTCDPAARASVPSRRRPERAIPLEAHLNEWLS